MGRCDCIEVTQRSTMNSILFVFRDGEEKNRENSATTSLICIAQSRRGSRQATTAALQLSPVENAPRFGTPVLWIDHKA